MKKTFFLSIILFISVFVSGQQLFDQDFNQSTDVRDYYNVIPSSNQFNEVSPNRLNYSIAIENGALHIIKTGPSYGYFLRSTSLGSPNKAISVSFKFKVSGNTEGGINQIQFYVGNNLPGKADPIDATLCHSRFGINFSDPIKYPEGFSIRNLETATNSKFFNGEQTITMVINNSDNKKTYISPLGQDENLSNDKLDIWVGNTKVFDDVDSFGSNVELNNFKLIYVYGAKNGIIDIDDFKIKSI